MIDPSPYIGIPYRLGGRDARGLDCWGLVRLVYREQLGLELPEHDTTPLAPQAVSREILTERQAWIAVPSAGVRDGDVAFMQGIGRPFHVGVVIGRRLLLHCDEGIATCVEPLDRQLGRVDFYRHPCLSRDQAAPVRPAARVGRHAGRALDRRDHRGRQA